MFFFYFFLFVSLPEIIWDCEVNAQLSQSLKYIIDVVYTKQPFLNLIMEIPTIYSIEINSSVFSGVNIYLNSFDFCDLLANILVYANNSVCYTDVLARLNFRIHFIFLCSRLSVLYCMCAFV